MRMRCTGCGKSFDARSDAKYCSGRCRQKAYQDKLDMKGTVKELVATNRALVLAVERLLAERENAGRG